MTPTNANRLEDATVVSAMRDTVPYSNGSYAAISMAQIREKEVVTAFARQARVRRAGLFVKGPIMLDDIGRAARLPGLALAVFLAIKHRVDLTRQGEVSLPKALMLQLGVSRDAKARALKALEAEGLIQVVRSRGRTAQIRLTLGNKQEGPSA